MSQPVSGKIKIGIRSPCSFTPVLLFPPTGASALKVIFLCLALQSIIWLCFLKAGGISAMPINSHLHHYFEGLIKM